MLFFFCWGEGKKEVLGVGLSFLFFSFLFFSFLSFFY